MSIALTYHSEHGVITCVCGELITGKHTCDTIEVAVCDFYSDFMKENDKVCRVCLVKEGEKGMKISGIQTNLGIAYARNVDLNAMDIFRNAAIVIVI